MEAPPSPIAEQQQEHEQEREQEQPLESTGTSSDSVFVWDPNSGLYYHASTGFYHDPVAGWYYSTRDGLYYAFQHGTYVPLDSHSQPQPQMDNDHDHDHGHEGTPPLNPTQGSPNLEEDQCASDHETQPQHDARPSQWLDELLINEYLSGYRHAGAHVGDEGEINDKLSEEIISEYISSKQEKDQTAQNASGTEGMLSAEEESWMAQYGQVDRSDGNEDITNAVDLWDWELIEETSQKRQNRKIKRLVGQLVGQTSSLHPSLPSSGGTLKTTAIRQVLLDLVLVASGKVYRLRTPSKRYLAMLSEYDSSDPTKDWGFPLFSPHTLSLPSPETTSDPSGVDLYPRNNQKECKYRDRAAERRRLHGANGIAPCQKDDDSNTDYASDDDLITAQEEARLLSFGTQSYANKIMQSMGWKQGEALGSSMKGILEPVEAKGNMGTAGLGWK